MHFMYLYVACKQLFQNEKTDVKGSTWVQIIYAVSHVIFFIFFLCPHVTFYKTLTSLSTVFTSGFYNFPG